MTCRGQIVLGSKVFSVDKHVIFKLFLAFLGINFFKDFVVFLVKVDCFVLNYWNVIVNCVTIFFHFSSTEYHIIKGRLIFLTNFFFQDFIFLAFFLKNVGSLEQVVVMTCGSQVVLSYVFISINEHVIFKLFLAFLGINFFKDFIVFLVKVNGFVLSYWNVIVNCVTIFFHF